MWKLGKTFWQKIHACCPPDKASIIKFQVDTTLVDGRLIENQANEKRFRNFYGSAIFKGTCCWILGGRGQINATCTRIRISMRGTILEVSEILGFHEVVG